MHFWHKMSGHAEEVKQSLRISIREGVATQVMIGIFDYYLVPLALFLKSSTQQIGFLVSVPSLVASLVQFFALWAITMAGGRKNLLTKGALTQAILLLPIGFLVFIDFPSRILWLIILVTIFRTLGGIVGPAWGSMVSAYLPENLRGEYFGKRSQVMSVAGLGNLFFWGMFLSLLNRWSSVAGFFVVFLTAAAMRFLSWSLLRKQVELPIADGEQGTFTFWMFIRRFRESNFVRYIFYVASLTFATQLSSAYFGVYMLQELKFSYIGYMSVYFSFMLTGLLTFPIWGRHADVVGNAKILKLTGLLISVSPFLWVLAQQFWQLDLIEGFSGFVWGGFNLCSANFIYDAVSAPKRAQCLGYFNLITGIAIFAGASLGGYLAHALPPISGSSLKALFVLSGLLRLAFHLGLYRQFSEVRAVTKVKSSKLFFSVLGVRPLIGPNIEWGLFPLVRHFTLKKLASSKP